MCIRDSHYCQPDCRRFDCNTWLGGKPISFVQPNSEHSGTSVSYTHLDVYKRQASGSSGNKGSRRGRTRWKIKTDNCPFFPAGESCEQASLIRLKDSLLRQASRQAQCWEAHSATLCSQAIGEQVRRLQECHTEDQSKRD